MLRIRFRIPLTLQNVSQVLANHTRCDGRKTSFRLHSAFFYSYLPCLCLKHTLVVVICIRYTDLNLLMFSDSPVKYMTCLLDLQSNSTSNCHFGIQLHDQPNWVNGSKFLTHFSSFIFLVSHFCASHCFLSEITNQFHKFAVVTVKSRKFNFFERIIKKTFVNCDKTEFGRKIE